MNKAIIYLIVIGVLGALAWYLVKDNQYKSSLNAIEEEYNFAIADTASITKIVIQDKVPSKVVLTRQENGWLVNGKYEARPDAIDVLLETMNRMTMRNFIPVPMEQTITNRLAVYGKEVLVYSGDEVIKHYYVGTETPDQNGTYMMLKGASKPYSVHLQGFVGYLNSRFFTGEDLWRRRIMFNLEQKNVAQVKLEYPTNAEASFIIDNTGETPVLTTLAGQPIPDALNVNLNLTLGSFKTASYEGTIVPTDGIWPKRDSLQHAPSAFVLTITTKDGQTRVLDAKYKKPDPGKHAEDEVLPEFDPSRLYAFLDDGRWVLIQYYGLRNIIVEREFYRQEILFDN